jgi:hypothetical protein
MQRKSRAQKKKGTRFSSSPYILVRLAGIEPTTPWFVAKYSIQLSYSREGRYYSTGMSCLKGVRLYFSHVNPNKLPAVTVPQQLRSSYHVLSRGIAAHFGTENFCNIPNISTSNNASICICGSSFGIQSSPSPMTKLIEVSPCKPCQNICVIKWDAS